MRIGFDASFGINDCSGIGRYSYNLIKYLLKIDKKNHYLLFFNFFRSRSSKLAKINELISDNKNVDVIINNYFGAIKDFIWHNPFISPIDIYFKALDVYHACCFQAFPGKINLKKSVLTIHDLTYLVDADFHQAKTKYFQKLTENAISKASFIISDSQSTQNDLIKFYGHKLPPSKVIYPGIETKFHSQSQQNVQQFKARYTAGSDYILAVGTLEPRKNLARLIQAYQLLPVELQKKYKLLVVGKNGWDSKINDFRGSNNIIFANFIADNFLLAGYSGASLFVYPSLYEGFGFPPLEAMACGVAVVASNVSSLPEIVGAAAVLVDPYNVEDISRAMKNILVSQKTQDNLIARGLEQVKQFNWQQTAQKTLEIYQQLAKNE